MIDETGKMIGKISRTEALNLAEEKELDLVLVSPNAEVPVCKLMDYGKYKFEMVKKEKEARKKQKNVEIKEIRLSATINKHDVETKQKNARRFIEDGDKVKVALKFKGREMQHTKVGVEVLNNFYEGLSDISTIEKEAKLEGRNMFMIIAPKK